MSSLYGAMAIATGALGAEQGALEATTNNVANVNTPGYSRLRPVLVENNPIVVGGLTYGTGVSLQKLESLRDPILQLRIQEETQRQGQLNASVTALQQTQVQFTTSNGDIGTEIANFFSSLSQLSTDPTNLGLRQGVLTAAANLSGAFNNTANNLSMQRTSLDQSVGQDVQQVIPRDLGVGVLVVQHMPVGFTGPFARRLDQLCQIEVKEAAHDEPVEAGVVYIAPAGQHLTVMRRASAKVVTRLSAFPEGTLHRPSVDVMMLSVAEVFGALAMGVIMTGMGADGVQGMKAIGKSGGLTLGQDEHSCVVYGMPRSCAEAGVLQRVVPLTQIPEEILHATGYHERAHRVSV